MRSVFGKRAAGLRLDRMKASPRWANGAFRNVHPILSKLKIGAAAPNFAPTLDAFLFGGGRRTPPAPLPSFDPRAAWEKSAETGLRATWLGHSTVLIEIDGLRLLTDPIWGERASPLTMLGPKRFQPVPVPLSTLPPLDAVLISHDHYDHLDYPTIVALARLGVPFVVPLGVGAHLEFWGVPTEHIIELDWWESYTLPNRELSITATPSQHFSGRGIRGRNETLWAAFAVKSPRCSFFFSGDTGLTPEYAEIRRRLGPFDLVMLEVGAFHPYWAEIHLGPENALEALSMLGGGSFLPIHWGTFSLALHPWDEPAEKLLELSPRKGAHLLLPKLGEPVEPTRSEKLTPWWRAAAEKKPSQSEGVLPLAPVPATEWPID